MKFLNDEKPRLLPLDAFATDAGPLSSMFQGVVDGTAFMVVWKRNIQPYLNAKGEFDNSKSEQNLIQGTPTCGQKRRSTAKVLLSATNNHLSLMMRQQWTQLFRITFLVGSMLFKLYSILNWGGGEGVGGG